MQQIFRRIRIQMFLYVESFHISTRQSLDHKLIIWLSRYRRYGDKMFEERKIWWIFIKRLQLNINGVYLGIQERIYEICW